MPAYNVTKYGVVALSEGLRVTRWHTGIGVSVLCPGFIRTQIMNSRPQCPLSDSPTLLRAQPTEGPVAEIIKVVSERVSNGIDPLYVGELVLRENRKRLALHFHR